MPHRRNHSLGYLLLSAGLMVPAAAGAEVIKCSFTEPFITTSYDTSSKRMTLNYDVEKQQQTLNGVSRRETARGTFEFKDSSGRLVLRTKRSCRGSDGMSDRRYPYEAELLIKNLYGACTSSNATKC